MRRRLRSAAPDAGTVALVVLATWLFWGYRWKTWPQPGFLDFVLRYSGELSNDWHTSLPPAHWAFTHALAVAPTAWLPGVAGTVWLLGLVVLWGGFHALCRSFGLSRPAALGAALVAIPTQFGGVGISDPPLGLLYPTSTSFALTVAGAALVLRDRLVWSGAVFGLAVLVHPNLGALAVICLAPLLVAHRQRLLARALRFAIPCAVLSAPALVEVVRDQLGGAKLSARDRYELLVIVRQPHHMLFSTFPGSEYLRTGLWVAVLLVGFVLLRRLAISRAVLASCGVVATVVAAGAWAGERGSPLTLVQLQTSRLTPYLILFAIVLGSAALSHLAPRWTPPLMFAAVVTATPVYERTVAELSVYAPERVSLPTVSAVLAAIVLAALLLAVIARKWPIGVGWQRHSSGWKALAPAVAILTVAAAAADLVARRAERAPQTPPLESAWRDVAEHARAYVPPGNLVLTPPDQDGFRDLGERPVVVEFGTFRYGKGDSEWVRRMNNLTHDPGALDAALGPDVSGRLARIAAGYDRVVATTPDPICRYGARLVVTRTSVPPPPWLDLVYRNDSYQALGIKDGVCPRH